MREEIRKILLGVVLENLKRAAMAAWPFLATPFVSKIFGFLFDQIVGRIATKVYDDMSLYVVFTVIDARVDGQLGAYDESLAKLSSAIEKGDQGAILDAREKAKAAFRDLVSLRSRATS